jgi:hypothetical protein
MKLLFDENLSHRLARLLEDLFPNSIHVRDVGLEAADDPLVWEYSKDNGLILVSKERTCISAVFYLALLPKWYGCAWGIARPQMWKDSCGRMFPPSPFSSMTLTRHFWFYPSVW